MNLANLKKLFLKIYIIYILLFKICIYLDLYSEYIGDDISY